MAYVRKEQPGIMIYWEAFDALEAMMDGEAKQMLKAMFISVDNLCISVDFVNMECSQKTL